MSVNCPCCGQCEGYGCNCEDWLLVKFWKAKCLTMEEQKVKPTGNTALVEADHEMISRVCKAQPKLTMAGDEGSYRHDDIARLLRLFARGLEQANIRSPLQSQMQYMVNPNAKPA